MKIKLGFTLSELMMALAIIGVLSALALNTIKPYDKGIKYLYSNVYNTLDRAYLAAMEDYMPQEEGLNPFSLSGAGEEDEVQGAEKLCKILTHYITATDETTCSADKAVGNTATDLDDTKIQFISINGMRFYISKRYQVQDTDYNDIQYYLVFVDLNGEKGPNTAEFVDGKDPDIFAFALLNSPTRVLPIGIAEINPKYLLTRLVHVPEATDGAITFEQQSYPYFINKARAWGYYNNNCEGLSNTTGTVADLLEGDILTYNDIIRADIQAQDTTNGANNIIISPVAGQLTYNNEIGDTTNDSGLPYSCSCGDADTCWVTIDRHAY